MSNAIKVLTGVLSSLLVAAVLALFSLVARFDRLEASLGSPAEARQLAITITRLEERADALEARMLAIEKKATEIESRVRWTEGLR